MQELAYTMPGTKHLWVLWKSSQVAWWVHVGRPNGKWTWRGWCWIPKCSCAPWSQQSWGPSHRLTICNGHHHTSWEFYAFFPGPNMLGAAEIWRSNQNSAESTGAWASCHLENQLQLLLPKQLPLKPVICEVKDVAKKECWPKNQGPVPTPENMRIAQAWHCWPHTPLAEHIAMACTRLECQKLHIWSFWLSCSWQHA